MLTAIIAVTLTVPDLPTAEEAYSRWFGYQVVERGLVSRPLAAGWGAPMSEGRRYVLLQPASGEPVYLRMVQSPATAGFEVMKTHGWNANEILVEDPDRLATQLDGSPFRIIGAPRPLSTSPAVRAMQVIGPAGELNYLTRIPPDGSSVFIKTSARSFVDRTFIVVLGGPSMAAMRDFYRDVLGMKVTEPVAAAINVLQNAYAQPASATTPLAIVSISDGFLIELDEYPAAARSRPRRDGDLPPGIAMVSFAAASLERPGLHWRVTPTVRPEAPYSGRRAGIIEGAAGEWLEIIEAR
jgi:catechol 2,3-dioxygenase-like lactoylglutathione lyase family enzyme